MKETKEIDIVSYYSDIDYADVNNNGIDGVYHITYPADVNIKKEIEKAYEELQEQDEMTNELPCMLDYLKDKGMNITYEVRKYVKFDCDYGNFDRS